MKTLAIALFTAAAAVAQPTPPEAPVPPTQPSPAAMPAPASAPMVRARAMARADWSGSQYRKGTRALDDRKYEDAVQAFDAVIASKETRADGALYWKAYALNKLGKRTEALATLDQLDKDHSGSAWLNDAKALRMEVQQNSGRPVSPESQSDEDLKLLAINGLMHSDPDRALPLLENLLRDPKAAPKVKERALFVMAQSRTPKSRDVILNIAKGGGNPDLQMRAIEYLGISGAQNEIAQLYTPSASIQVREAVINSLMMTKNIDKLADIARAEKETRLRVAAIERIGMVHGDKTAGLLVSLYGGDADAKRAVMNALTMQHNSKQLVDLARKESDPQMKKELVERLSMMKDKEATDYMLELLK